MKPEAHNERGSPPPDLYLGRRLGSYELTERVGEGGMGAVYRARHVETGEQVAIKLIKRGMDTDALLRRFHNERRILGAIDHPNIARLLDAGSTEDGLPYFVMEFIVGVPLNEYCDERKLTVTERLLMFRKICSAVQCTHDIHVIHRDIKPENILVTASGEPKLLDFGIAKILDRDMISVSQEVTLTLGAVMTPRYASPEQALGEPLGPSTDIYSLGVLLYELLTGHSPYRPTGRSAHELVEAICHQDPEPPSVAVRRLGPSDPSAMSISTHRGSGPETLQRSLAGDLDAIILTALQKDPHRRYASVAEFSADIGRHLHGDKVNARKFRAWLVRASQWSRRRVLVAAATGLLIMVAGLWYLRISRAGVAIRPSVAVMGFENLSRQPATEWLGTALTEMLTTELAAGGRLRTVPGELISRVKLELALPNAQTFTTSTLGRLRRSLGADYVVLGSYLALGDATQKDVRLDLRLQDTSSGEVVAAVSETRPSSDLLTLVTRSGTLLRRRLGAGDMRSTDSGSLRGSLPTDPEAARNYAEGLERLRTFDTLAARDLLRNAVTMAPDHALSHAALAAACSLLGYDTEARDEAKKALDLSVDLSREDRLSIEGRYYETTRAWNRAIETFASLHKEFPDNLEYGLRLAAAQTQSGEGRHALNTIAGLRSLPQSANDPRVDLAETEASLATSDLARARVAARRAAQSGSAQGFRILAARAHLLESRVFLEMGDPQRALTAAAQSQSVYQAAGHRQGVALALNESGGVLTQLGDVSGARARYEEALEVCRTIGDQTCIGTDLDSLGVLRRRQGDLQGSLDMHEQALEIRRAVGDRAGVATTLYNLGNVLEVLGDLPRARTAAAESLELRGVLGQGRSAALTMSRLASIRRRLGELNDAVGMNEQAVGRLRAIGDRGGTAMALLNLGLALFDQGDVAPSRAVLEEALSIRRQQQDKNNTAQALAALAIVALVQDRLPEAQNLITESISLRQGLGELISLAQSKLVLVDILLEQGQVAAAAGAAREAVQTFRNARAPGLEAEAHLALARAQLAGRQPGPARQTIDSANRLLRDSRDALHLLVRDAVSARTELALGRRAEALSVLDRALAQAGRLKLKGAVLELRLAKLEAGSADEVQLAADAQRAGYLRIARRAAALGSRSEAGQ